MGPHEVKKKFNFLVENHYRVREKTLVESEYVINLSYTDKHGNQMVFFMENMIWEKVKVRIHTSKVADLGV